MDQMNRSRNIHSHHLNDRALVRPDRSGYRLLYYLQTIKQIVEEMRGGGARRTRFAGQTGACLSGKVRPLFPSLKGREAAVAIRRPRLRDRRVG
jgi:hypothetical protein